MSDELRAAAEFILSGDYVADEKTRRQGKLLARAYLAEHRDDDGEVPTEEKMLRLGFRDGQTLQGSKVLTLCSVSSGIIDWYEISPGRLAIQGTADIYVGTLGGVRKFLAALNITDTGRKGQ